MLLENLNISSPTTGNGERPKPSILELIIQKDRSGYGMKVSGENPVFVDSVKEGGAAFRAGLLASDMILRVNGQMVKFSTHAEVVQLIKATQNVKLTVQRNVRNFAVQSGGGGGSGNTTPGTPTSTSQRNSITAPLPVDVSRIFPTTWPCALLNTSQGCYVLNYFFFENVFSTTSEWKSSSRKYTRCT